VSDPQGEKKAFVENTRYRGPKEENKKQSLKKLVMEAPFKLALLKEMAGCAHRPFPAPWKEASVCHGRITICDSLVHPCVHLRQQPRNPTGAKLYPLGELACRFKTRDVLRRIWDATDCP
jgi:hypothetical protein